MSLVNAHHIGPTHQPCAIPDCPAEASWAARGLGRVCPLHACDAEPLPDDRHPAHIRIERARALMVGGAR